MPVTPYVVGQWVRKEKFYGRGPLIKEILTGNRSWVWVLGTRRIGKTSLLKQLEYLLISTPGSRYFPIFWDFQGAENPDELHRTFNDALLDAEDRLIERGIEPEELEESLLLTNVLIDALVYFFGDLFRFVIIDHALGESVAGETKEGVAMEPFS